MQVALLPISDKQGGTLTNTSMKTDMQSSQVTVLTRTGRACLDCHHPVNCCKGSGPSTTRASTKLAMESIHIRSQPNPLTRDKGPMSHVYIQFSILTQLCNSPQAPPRMILAATQIGFAATQTLLYVTQLCNPSHTCFQLSLSFPYSPLFTF